MKSVIDQIKDKMKKGKEDLTVFFELLNQSNFSGDDKTQKLKTKEKQNVIDCRKKSDSNGDKPSLNPINSINNEEFKVFVKKLSNLTKDKVN